MIANFAFGKALAIEHCLVAWIPKGVENTVAVVSNTVDCRTRVVEAVTCKKRVETVVGFTRRVVGNVDLVIANGTITFGADKVEGVLRVVCIVGVAVASGVDASVPSNNVPIDCINKDLVAARQASIVANAADVKSPSESGRKVRARNVDEVS